ncbi:MAG: glycosyltransferase family 4 protein [Dichotomicrobium sp.]
MTGVQARKAPLRVSSPARNRTTRRHPPRILVIGGSDHDLRVPFLRELAGRGFDVAAAGTGPAEPFARCGIAYYAYSFDRFIDPLADWRALRDLRRIVSRFQPDIVHSFDTKPGLMAPVAARAKPGARVVRTINGLGWLFSSASLSARALRPAFTILHRVTAPWTTLTVFQNRSDAAFFRERGITGTGDCCLIPGSGADIANFRKRRAEGPSPAELRTALGLGGSEVVITVTRLSRVKGIPALLEAAAIVHAQRPGVRFLLVGPRETEGKLAIAQAELDRHAPYVMAIGARPDVPSLLGVADVFAFPTELFEGVPRVLLEAGLAGLPIVTTDMPGCSDVVRGGEGGFVVPVGQPERLAARILDVLNDLGAAREMGARARRHVEENFSLDTVVDSYAAAYARLLGEPAHSAPVRRSTVSRANHAAPAPRTANEAEPAPPTAASRPGGVGGHTKSNV